VEWQSEAALENDERPEPAAHPPKILQSLPRLVLLLFLPLSGLLLAGAGYWASENHPDYAIPRGAAAEERIVELFGAPEEDADPELIGDLLIERFYAVEPATGRRIVADMCKGRVKYVVETELENGLVKYSVLLDRRGLNPTGVRALVEKYSPPDPDVTYMGVRVQGGNDEVFPVNYSGRLPRTPEEFRSPNGQDVYTFLSSFKSTDVGRTPRLLPVKDNVYLLSSTELYPYFTSLFRVQEAVFITELQFLDATANEAAGTLNP
jgi:hypothetical protein